MADASPCPWSDLHQGAKAASGAAPPEKAREVWSEQAHNPAGDARPQRHTNDGELIANRLAEKEERRRLRAEALAVERRAEKEQRRRLRAEAEIQAVAATEPESYVGGPDPHQLAARLQREAEKRERRAMAADVHVGSAEYRGPSDEQLAVRTTVRAAEKTEALAVRAAEKTDALAERRRRAAVVSPERAADQAEQRRATTAAAAVERQRETQSSSHVDPRTLAWANERADEQAARRDLNRPGGPAGKPWPPLESAVAAVPSPKMSRRATAAIAAERRRAAGQYPG